jgi:hypothetical protein
VRACARACCVGEYQTVGLCVLFVLLRDVRSAPSRAHATRAFTRSRNQIDRRTQAHHDAAHKRCGLRTSACSCVRLSGRLSGRLFTVHAWDRAMLPDQLSLFYQVFLSFLYPFSLFCFASLAIRSSLSLLSVFSLSSLPSLSLASAAAERMRHEGRNRRAPGQTAACGRRETRRKSSRGAFLWAHGGHRPQSPAPLNRAPAQQDRERNAARASQGALTWEASGAQPRRYDHRRSGGGASCQGQRHCS